jgi:hypothetical protein
MNIRSLALRLALAVTTVGCGPISDGEAEPARLDLRAIVIAPDAPPDGMTLSDEGRGSAVLEQLPLFEDTASQLQATPGFVDGRWSRFAGSASDFEDSRGFILTWVAQFATEANARNAASILLNELQTEEGYGWGIGDDAGLGDEGTCLDGANPQMGGLEETICVWRRGTLVMVVGGGQQNDTPIEDAAAAMDLRAAELLP